MKTSPLLLLIAVTAVTHSSLAAPTIGIRVGLNLANISYFDGGRWEYN